MRPTRRGLRPDHVLWNAFKKSDLEHEKRLAGVDYPGTAKDLDVAEARDMQADYFAMVELIDHNVGRLLDYLEENDLRENTLLTYTLPADGQGEGERGRSAGLRSVCQAESLHHA